jgi:small subunit ribosomal protein S4
MGDPKFSRKKYETPTHPWEAGRIEREREVILKYGLKNKKEVWKAETFLRRIRGQARRLFAREGEKQAEKEKDELLKRLAKLGVLPVEAKIDDVLALTLEDVLGRRLQTLVYLHGLANTPKHARQLIIHGHIAINGRKFRVPSYIVRKGEEDMISYTPSSPLTDELHPMRPQVEKVEIKGDAIKRDAIKREA